MGMNRRQLLTATGALLGVLAGGGATTAAAVKAYTDKDCVKCHKAVVQAVAASAGKHAEVGCTTCHEGHPPAVKEPYPQCTACHEPHGEGPASADCTQCHRAHAPTQVAYGVSVPSEACGACHAGVLAELAASTTKHGTLACAICHRAQHGATRQCGECHGRLHPESIMARFPRCAECHNTAHDLNHLPAAK